MEEPGLFQTIMERADEITKPFVDLFLTHNFKRVIYTGSGSPSNVARILYFATIKLLGIDAKWSWPGLFLNHDDFDPLGLFKPEELLLICPAESGRTKGPILIAQDAKRRGIPVVSTIHRPDGTLAKLSTVVIQKPSGKEIAIPSTKGHSTGLFLLLLCLVETAYRLERITPNIHTQLMLGFHKLSHSIESAIASTTQWFYEHQATIMQAPNFRFIAYGPNYSTAVEATLKFIESHRKPSVAYELEEFLHGPIRAIQPDDVLFFLLTEDGPEKNRMIDLYQSMRTFTGKCVLVHGIQDNIIDSLSLSFNTVNLEFLSCIEYLVPFQVLSFLISYHLGIDLTQSTTTPVVHNLKPSFED